jgi:hypothetical protein
MPEEIYYLRVKKSYAADVIEDLQKMEAIELLSEPPVPEWQKAEVRRRLEEAKKNPEQLVSWDEAIKKIEEM